MLRLIMLGPGVQVDRLHLCLVREGKLAAFTRHTSTYIRANMQLCSATLTTLFLEGLDLGHCFDRLHSLDEHEIRAGFVCAQPEGDGRAHSYPK